jgi:predicted nucleic-acid-binding protein
MNYTADSSFLIGLLVDEPRTKTTKDIFYRLKKKKEKIYIPDQAIIEVIYVLEKFYKFERGKIADYIRAILDTYIFIVEKYEMYYSVMELYVKNPKINLGDIIIAGEARSRGIHKVLSFDKHFQVLGMEVVSSG